MKTPWRVTVGQNANMSANDYLELEVTQNGTPTSLSSAKIIAAVRGVLRGA